VPDFQIKTNFEQGNQSYTINKFWNHCKHKDTKSTCSKKHNKNKPTSIWSIIIYFEQNISKNNLFKYLCREITEQSTAMIEVKKIDYNSVSAFSFKDLSYINQAPFLRDFYKYTPDLSSFDQVIKDRKAKTVNRSTLVTVLKENYSKITASDLQNQNIAALESENTFTIITAHQPSLFGGPLYYVLKIASAINLCHQLSEKYPSCTFVPTFVSGGEDHDFDEVDHLHLFGKTVKWQRNAQGPVGRLDLSNLEAALTEVTDILGSHPLAEKMASILNQSLEGSESYGDFVFKFVNNIFSKYGVLVLNMDNHKFKKDFIPAMKKEILENTSKPIVNDTQKALEEHKFKAQAFPRDINLFYLGDGKRERIEWENDQYKIIDSTRSFTKDELLQELNNKPENFSPNVVMRPLFQETCLPNLAYVGGGGEIAYWLERKAQFEAFDVFFPMLIRRNSAMIINKGMKKNIAKIGFTIEDTLKKEDILINEYISKNTNIEVSLEDQKSSIQSAYEAIAEKSKSVDPSLAKSVLADMTKQLKNVDQMESRIKRTLKSQQEVQVNKIRKIKSTLYPNLGLQERYDNFMPHYLSIGEDFFDLLVNNLDPMDRRFTVFVQE